MTKFDVRWAALITFVVLFLGWWYWYQYRPQKIEEECYRFSLLMTRAASGESGKVSWSTAEHYHDVVKLFKTSCVDAGGVEWFKKTIDAADPFKEAN